MNNPFAGAEEKTRNQKEFRLQCHIVKMHDIYFPHVMMTAFPGRPGDATDGFFKKVMGVKSGVSDINLFWDYEYPNWALSLLARMTAKLGFGFSKMHSGMMELKVDSGLSGAQNKWHSRFHAHGGHTGVARSWEQYFKGLCKWGIKPKSTPNTWIEPDYRTDSQKHSDAFEMYRP